MIVKTAAIAVVFVVMARLVADVTAAAAHVVAVIVLVMAAVRVDLVQIADLVIMIVVLVIMIVVLVTAAVARAITTVVRAVTIAAQMTVAEIISRATDKMRAARMRIVRVQTAINKAGIKVGVRNINVDRIRSMVVLRAVNSEIVSNKTVNDHKTRTARKVTSTDRVRDQFLRRRNRQATPVSERRFQDFSKNYSAVRSAPTRRDLNIDLL